MIGRRRIHEDGEIGYTFKTTNKEAKTKVIVGLIFSGRNHGESNKKTSFRGGTSKKAV